MKDTSTAERKLGTHFEFASGPRPFPKDRAGPIGQWSQNFRCPVLAVFLVSLPWLQISQQVLDLEFLAPDSGGFIPMYFSNARRAIGYGRDNIQTEALPS
jgi:hypothetical protein